MAAAASFDCDKAKSKIEKLICSDPEISNLDDVLNITYKGALSRVADKPGLRQAQRAWLTSYALSSCSEVECLKSELRGDMLEVSKESGCGGLNVTFNGLYKRK